MPHFKNCVLKLMWMIEGFARHISSFTVLRQPDRVYLLPEVVTGEYLCFLTIHTLLLFQCFTAVHHPLRGSEPSNVCQPGSLWEFGWQSESMGCVCGGQAVMALCNLMCQQRAWYKLLVDLHYLPLRSYSSKRQCRYSTCKSKST